MPYSTLNSLHIAQGLVRNRDLNVCLMNSWKSKHSKNFHILDNYEGSGLVYEW